MTCPFDAMGSTMATYAGQNVGAGKFQRLKEGVIACTKLGVIYSILALVFVLLFGGQAALLFVDAGETVIVEQVRLFLLGNSSFYIALALVNIVRFTIQGMGFSRLAILAGVCEMVGRSFVGFVIVPALGYTAVCYASPIAWVMADIFLIPAFIYCVRVLEKKRLNGKMSEKLCAQ